MAKKNRDIRNRNDAYYLSAVDPFHVVMPYVMPGRTANEAVMATEVDLKAVQEYIDARNAENPDFKYTVFHCVCAALAKTMYLRPKMNWFISNYRMYEHREIQIAFVIKREFDEKGAEALVKLIVDPAKSAIGQVHDFVKAKVRKVRGTSGKEGIDRAFNLYSHLPRPVFRFFVWLLRCMDYFGFYPKSLATGDPCYSSCFLTNLGSIGMKADYHHLFNWGTCSVFMIISQIKDGKLPLSFTVDERVADGFYYMKCIKLMEYLLQHPALLEESIEVPVDMD